MADLTFKFDVDVEKIRAEMKRQSEGGSLLKVQDGAYLLTDPVRTSDEQREAMKKTWNKLGEKLKHVSDFVVVVPHKKADSPTSTPRWTPSTCTTSGPPGTALTCPRPDRRPPTAEHALTLKEGQRMLDRGARDIAKGVDPAAYPELHAQLSKMEVDHQAKQKAQLDRLVQALEAGGYNAAPSKLTQGCGGLADDGLTYAELIDKDLLRGVADFSDHGGMLPKDRHTTSPVPMPLSKLPDIDVDEKKMTVGEVLENFMGVKGASKDPAFVYERDPSWFQQRELMMQKGRDEVAEATKRVLEHINTTTHNKWGTVEVKLPTPIDFIKMDFEVTAPGVDQAIGRMRDSFNQMAKALDKVSACECGAKKAHNAERGSALHSSWCPESKP